ncbi:hypothetical protein G9C85_13390 [Halorubellus sp. JP-L1]|uniref:hypothetical protein n=1 Tax=Halorubellus sp. JP-L1 TaxID=2715753 RepID=UPI0014081ABE|nr:hypothetical protein [Halorubellus sp. JP-L1]NHN42615.1 hypothetical protein [Halorubellus sp. JP-L1]
MRRRTVLAGASVFATSGSGCLNGFPGTGTAEFTAADPPEGVHERGECSTERVVASVSFDGPLDAPGDESAVVRYRDLTEPSQSLIRFVLARGGAVACESQDPATFRSLLGDFGDMTDRYRETHGEGPRHHEVRAGDAYHRLDRLRVRDQVLDG